MTAEAPSKAASENGRGAEASLLRRKTRGILLVGLLVLLAAAGVRVWWDQGAPARAARQAEIDRTTQRGTRLRNARQAVVDRPKDAAAYDQLASALMAAGQVEEALASWRKGTEVAPTDRLAWQHLANAYLAEKRFAAAETTFQDMARRWPQDAGPPQGLAVVYRHSARYREALDAARKAVQLAPKEPLNHYVLGTLIQEVSNRTGFPQGQGPLLEEGRRHLVQAGKVLPNHPDIDYRLARICLLLRRTDEAKKALEKAAMLTPERGVVWLALADVRLRAGDVDGAVEAARQARRVTPLEPEAPLAEGRALLLKNDKASLEAAVAAFENSVRLKPEHAPGHDRLGTALLRLDRLPEARAAFEKALQLDENNPYPAQQLSQIYRRQGETERAVKMAKLAETLAYNDRLLRQVQRTSVAHPENPRIHLALAKRYRELGWLPQAEDEYQLTLTQEPNNKQAREGLAATRHLMAQRASH